MAKVIQIRDVPEEVHRQLSRQAEAAGLSLNRFLLQEVERIVRRGRNTRVLTRAANRRGKRLSSTSIVEAVREDRQRHK